MVASGSRMFSFSRSGSSMTDWPTHTYMSVPGMGATSPESFPNRLEKIFDGAGRLPPPSDDASGLRSDTSFTPGKGSSVPCCFIASASSAVSGSAMTIFFPASANDVANLTARLTLARVRSSALSVVLPHTCSSYWCRWCGFTMIAIVVETPTTTAIIVNPDHH